MFTNDIHGFPPFSRTGCPLQIGYFGHQKVISKSSKSHPRVSHISSKSHQLAIQKSSMSHQPVIKKSSTSHQIVIHESSTFHQPVINKSSKRHPCFLKLSPMSEQHLINKPSKSHQQAINMFPFAPSAGNAGLSLTLPPLPLYLALSPVQPVPVPSVPLYAGVTDTDTTLESSARPSVLLVPVSYLSFF